MVNKNSTFRLGAGLCCGGLLLFHAYYYCNAGFAEWGLTAPVLDRLARALAGVAILSSRDSSKIAILIALALTQVGGVVAGMMPGRREVVRGLGVGLLVYFGADGLLYLTGDPAALSSAYLLMMGVGLVMAYKFIRPVTAWVSVRLSQNIFNRFNESFPQEERHLPAPFSIHLAGTYWFRNQTRTSVINLVNIMRGTLVVGNPGSGKTRNIIRPLIRQSLELGMAMFVYDLKYPDLSEYVWWCMRRKGIANDPRVYYSMNFDVLSKSHRCNPLHPRGLHDINDAFECSRTILLALDKEMTQREGGFFKDSAVNIVAAGIWFLRSYADSRYCTLPHLIELLQQKQTRLLSILMSCSETRSVIGGLAESYEEGATDMLLGQAESARVMLAPLASPAFYYLLSGDDFSLDINNPAAPKVVCMGSNPEKAHIYGVAASLLMNRMLKAVNRAKGIASHVIVDEFGGLKVMGMADAVATVRDKQVATTLGIQDLSQLRVTYGRDQADVLFNLPGNLFCGQVSGDSAKAVSERFGRILQEKSTISINSRDSSVSQSQQLDFALPTSKIATFSSGEFAGITADSPDQPLPLKAFHAQIMLDPVVREYEKQGGRDIPDVMKVEKKDVQANFQRIKDEVEDIVTSRLAEMEKTAELKSYIIKRKGGGRGSGLRKRDF